MFHGKIGGTGLIMKLIAKGNTICHSPKEYDIARTYVLITEFIQEPKARVCRKFIFKTEAT